MTILLVSDDDRSALACNLLADQLKRRGQGCLPSAPWVPIAGESCLSVSEIPLGLMDLLGTDLLNSASAIGILFRPDQIQPSLALAALWPGNATSARRCCSVARWTLPWATI